MVEQATTAVAVGTLIALSINRRFNPPATKTTKNFSNSQTKNPGLPGFSPTWLEAV